MYNRGYGIGVSPYSGYGSYGYGSYGGYSGYGSYGNYGYGGYGSCNNPYDAESRCVYSFLVKGGHDLIV